MMGRTSITLRRSAAMIAVTASAVGAQDYDAPRNATVDAAGATIMRLDARAGSLRIEGRSGISEVRVRGTARASSRDLLEEIKLEANRSGAEVRVQVVIPEMRDWNGGNRYAALDLVIEVPVTLPLDVRDSSGETEIRNVARLEIEDSSGDLVIENVAGALRVDDNSGSIRIREAGADVWISDSSGEIEVRGVKGSVEIAEDSSGEIEVTDVTGSVRIGRDSSGSIDVSRVGGDFTVGRDGGGYIDHRDVKGKVDIPRRRR